MNAVLTCGDIDKEYPARIDFDQECLMIAITVEGKLSEGASSDCNIFINYRILGPEKLLALLGLYIFNELISCEISGIIF